MATAILQRFQNPDRPDVTHTQVNEIPVDQFGPQLSREILDSLNVDGDNNLSCAGAARLWEEALESHPGAPFLLLKVADMRFALSSPVMASILYEQLPSVYRDAAYTTWSYNFKNLVIVHTYKTSTEFAGSRRWVSAMEYYTEFPSTTVSGEALESLCQQWPALKQEDLLMKFLNVHCIETNVLEGTMLFTPSSATQLIQVGFYNQALSLKNEDVIGGDVRTSQDALSILRDTRKTLDLVFGLIKQEKITLTVDILCSLHHTMMRSSRVLSVNVQGQSYLKYVAIGVTRKVSRSNVHIKTFSGGRVQFCPFDAVDKELEFFCTRFNELMETPNIDPFAAAAWIHHVFITIHPFEDGNGRLSRILSSIPLLKRDLPPLCIRASAKVIYIDLLTELRQNPQNTNYKYFMDHLVLEMLASLESLAALPVK